MSSQATSFKPLPASDVPGSGVAWEARKWCCLGGAAWEAENARRRMPADRRAAVRAAGAAGEPARRGAPWAAGGEGPA